MPDVIDRTNHIPQQRLHRFRTVVLWSVVTGWQKVSWFSSNRCLYA